MASNSLFKSVLTWEDIFKLGKGNKHYDAMMEFRKGNARIDAYFNNLEADIFVEHIKGGLK